MKSHAMAAALVLLTATAAMAQVQQPRIQMPSPAPQVGPQINRDLRPPPEVRQQDLGRPLPDSPRAATGYYRDTDGMLRLRPGCRWVDPNDSNDLRTYCN